MAKTWLDVLNEKATIWGVPTSEKGLLKIRTESAELALQVAQSGNRSPTTTAECKADFDALTAKMRFFHSHYFLQPPLTDADLVSLLLKPHDDTPTHAGSPTAEVLVETFLVGRHQLGIRIIYTSGNPDDPANEGYRIWYKVAAPGEAPPTGPEDLHESFYTRRSRDLMEFAFGDSGKTAWFCVQVEHGGAKGPWEAMVPALIP
jgi:hypothetical protein